MSGVLPQPIDRLDVKCALISVSDKKGLAELGKRLAARNVCILSTSSTGTVLEENDVDVLQVRDYTGFPEIMGGRVKTLHPKIYGGILERGDIDNDVLAAYLIESIDLVVVNLYPFKQTAADPKMTFEETVEQIDIGGPTLIRAAAKNHFRKAVVCDPNDYDKVLCELESGGITRELRNRLAVTAFLHTRDYDGAIATHFRTQYVSAPRI